MVQLERQTEQWTAMHTQELQEKQEQNKVGREGLGVDGRGASKVRDQLGSGQVFKASTAPSCG